MLFGPLVSVGGATTDDIGRVKRVADGDTILLEDGRRIRYLGVNSPEYQEPFYLKAKRFNESLVLGQEVRLEFDEEVGDAYGRALAYVYVRDQMANARLVQEGLAHAFFIGPARRHNALLLQLQEEARQHKVGIWSARARPRDLKITSVHVGNGGPSSLAAPYVRITNLGRSPVRLAGYVLSNEAGQQYRFPAASLDPGYTVVVAGGAGLDGVDERGQLVLHWPGQAAQWDAREDTAFLADPTGALLDSFHYKGRRATTLRP